MVLAKIIKALTHFITLQKNAIKWVNHRRQKKSMNWTEFVEYIELYPLSKPKIAHFFYSSHVRWIRLKLNVENL